MGINGGLLVAEDSDDSESRASSGMLPIEWGAMNPFSVTSTDGRSAKGSKIGRPGSQNTDLFSGASWTVEPEVEIVFDPKDDQNNSDEQPTVSKEDGNFDVDDDEEEDMDGKDNDSEGSQATDSNRVDRYSPRRRTADGIPHNYQNSDRGQYNPSGLVSTTTTSQTFDDQIEQWDLARALIELAIVKQELASTKRQLRIKTVALNAAKQQLQDQGNAVARAELEKDLLRADYEHSPRRLE